jgi:hypothetical protein
MTGPLRSLLVAFPHFSVGRLALLIGSALLAASCTANEDLFSDTSPLDPLGGRPGNLPVFAPPVLGAGGGEGNVNGEGGLGTAQQGQREADAGPLDGGAPVLTDAGADGGVTCELASDCVDDNTCTFDDCVEGRCRHTPANAGVACGNATESTCTRADSCDGAGRCLPNDAPAQTPCGRTGNACAADACNGTGVCVARDLPTGTACGNSSGCGQPTCGAGAVCEPHDTANGSACPGGSCTVGACVEGQRVGCPRAVATALPFQTSWSSVGQPNLFLGECQSDDTPDFAVEFVVPATGRYRFEATGSPDSVLTLVRGACTPNGTQAAATCNDDISENNRGSRIDVALTAAQILTIYVSEFGEDNTGSGTLRISAL